MHFKKIDNLPIINLFDELLSMLAKDVIYWHHDNGQICLNTTTDTPDNFLKGCGSLIWDWDNATEYHDKNGDVQLSVPKFEKELQESDFNTLCSQFKNTGFETVYRALDEKYHLGRVRLMRSQPKTCLTWHVDHHPRVHFPIKTQEGCFMVIEDQVKFMPENTWWYTNTLVKHTAFNGSGEPRIHLVATIIGTK